MGQGLISAILDDDDDDDDDDVSICISRESRMVQCGKKRLSRMHRHLGGPEVSRCSRINIRKCPLSVLDERAGLLIIKNAAGGIHARVYARTYVRVYDNRVCMVTVNVLV